MSGGTMSIEKMSVILGIAVSLLALNNYLVRKDERSDYNNTKW